MNKPWKLIVLLVGIFVAGGATGALLAKRMAQVMPSPPKPPPAAETWASLHLKRIADDLQVKPDQMEQIRPIVVRGMRELFSMRSQFLADNRARREQMEREVMQVLTPEQREKYEKINREFQERTRKLEKGGPPPDRNGRPPDGFKKEREENRPPPPDRPRDS
jgi:Spy/CpxP family protein refolding chaperone